MRGHLFCKQAQLNAVSKNTHLQYGWCRMAQRNEKFVEHYEVHKGLTYGSDADLSQKIAQFFLLEFSNSSYLFGLRVIDLSRIRIFYLEFFLSRCFFLLDESMIVIHVCSSLQRHGGHCSEKAQCVHPLRHLRDHVSNLIRDVVCTLEEIGENIKLEASTESL